MGWLEGILDFLRHGPKGGKLDMNALFQGAVDMSQISKSVAIEEINSLINWQKERKRWHHDKTRQKMAAEGSGSGSTDGLPGLETFRSSDFGLNEVCCLFLYKPLKFQSLVPTPLIFTYLFRRSLSVHYTNTTFNAKSPT